MMIIAENASTITVTSGQIMWFALASAALLLTAIGLFLNSINRIGDKKNLMMKEIADGRILLAREIAENRTEVLLQGQRVVTLEKDMQSMRTTLHSVDRNLMTLNVGVAKIVTKMDIDHQNEFVDPPKER